MVENLAFRLSDVGVATSATPVFLSDMSAETGTAALPGPVCVGPNPPKPREYRSFCPARRSRRGCRRCLTTIHGRSRTS